MNNGIGLISHILVLRDEAYRRFGDLPRVFERGLRIIILVGLLVGAVNAVVWAVNALNDQAPQAARQQTKDQVLGDFDQAVDYAQVDPQIVQDIRDYIEIGIDITYDIQALRAPFIRPVRRVFQAIGRALSTPFSYLSSWMFYTLLVLFFAKLFRGQASVQRMLGMTALQFVPYVLNVLNPIPYVGWIFGVVAAVWGFFIYVKATAVANEFTTLRGFLVTILPVVVAIALVLILVPATLIWIMVNQG